MLLNRLGPDVRKSKHFAVKVNSTNLQYNINFEEENNNNNNNKGSLLCLKLIISAGLFDF